MASVNLGSIKFNWKGAYNAGTAYAVDDVVSHSGNSYVCILASTGNVPTNTTYWNIMSQAGTNGTNGTDLTSTLTTQGDIVYRDGSGLQRLAAGTSGHALITKGSGQNPVWESVSGHLVSFHYSYDNTNRTTTSTSFGLHGSSTAIQITPASANSKFLLIMTAQFGNNQDSRRAYYKFHRDGSELGNSEANLEIVGSYSNEIPASASFYDSPNTTSQITYDLRFHANGGGDTAKLNYQRFSIFEFAS